MIRYARRLLFGLALALWAGPVSADTMTLAWNPSSGTNIAGYRLAYGTQPGVHPFTVDTGQQTSWQLTGLADGQRYYFVVRAYDTSGLVSLPSQEVSGVALGLVAVLSTASSNPIPTGASVTWTAHAGTGATLEYQFSRQIQPSGTWTVVQNYSPLNTFTWTPSTAQLGTYVIRVWARTVGSTESYEVSRSTAAFTVANSPIKVGSVDASVALPAPTGSAITWRARATGGPAPLQYRFYRLNKQTGSWTLARDYSAIDTFTWTPASGDQGAHLVQVWVRGTGSAAEYDAWRNSESFEIENGPRAVASLTTATSLPAGTGAPITWKAVASGGPGPLEYQFHRLSVASGTWTVVRDYGSSDSYTWTPTSQGAYVLQVWVRRVGSTAAYESWAGTPQFQILNSVPVVRGISSDAGSPMGTGSPVTWTADAVGGPGQLQYRFWLFNVSRDTWSIVRDYSTNKSFSWTPSASDTGSYTLQVWVRRQGSSATYEAWSVSAFSVVATPATIVAITNNVGTSGTVGMPITWIAKPAAGQGPLEYKFIRYNLATRIWTVVQQYSWDNSFGWVPTAGEQGSYTFQVWVRRSGSSLGYEGWGGAGPFVVN